MLHSINSDPTPACGKMGFDFSELTFIFLPSRQIENFFASSSGQRFSYPHFKDKAILQHSRPYEG